MHWRNPPLRTPEAVEVSDRTAIKPYTDSAAPVAPKWSKSSRNNGALTFFNGDLECVPWRLVLSIGLQSGGVWSLVNKDYRVYHFLQDFIPTRHGRKPWLRTKAEVHGHQNQLSTFSGLVFINIGQNSTKYIIVFQSVFDDFRPEDLEMLTPEQIYSWFFSFLKSSICFWAYLVIPLVLRLALIAAVYFSNTVMRS